MISNKKAVFLVVAIALLVPLAAAASDSGSCIASMSASLDSAVLINDAGPTEVTVVSSPTPILLVGDEGELKGEIGNLTVPAGSPTTYDHVRVTLSSIHFNTFEGCTTGGFDGNPSTLTDLVIDLDDDEGDGVEEIVPEAPFSLEIEFSAADGLVSDGAGCFTGEFVADPAPAFEADLEDDAGEEEDLELSGVVGTISDPTFELDVNNDGTPDYVITTDGSTQWDDPLTGIGSLGTGDLVEVEVIVQADGTVLATEVELLFDEDATEGGATGRIACVDDSSSEAGFITLVFAPSNPDMAFPAATVQVNLNGSTKYKVNKGNINISCCTFDASHLSPGQRITAAGTPVGGGTAEIDATKLILKLQQLNGMVVDGSVDTSAGTFQLMVTSASDVLLTEPLLVQTSPQTRFAGKVRNLGGLNTTDTYQIKGILIQNSNDGTLTFLAKKIKKQTGNAP